MDLFDNGKPEELWLFVMNFRMALEASGMLAAGANIQCLCTLLRGKAVRQIDTLSIEVLIMTSDHLKIIILGLGTSFSPGNTL